MFREFASRLFGGSRLDAASQLPDVPLPKVKKNGISLPSFLKTAKPNTDAPLPYNDRRLINADITALRNGNGTRTVMRDFIAASPDLSAAVFQYIRNAVSNGYQAVAKNPDGTFHPEATAALQQILTRFDVLTNYADGYASLTSLQSTSESLVKEIMTYGAMSAELVLDQALLPARIQPVSVTNVKFYPDSKGVLKPVQEVGGQKFVLDTPAYVYVSLDQDLLEPYAASPLESAMQPTLFGQEFMNDVRRIVQRVIHPRLHVKIEEEKLIKHLTDKAQHDDELRKQEIDAAIQQVADAINNLQPEEAIVLLDSIEIDLLNNGNISLSDEYKVIKEIIDAKLSTGAKTMPAILGHGVGSSNIASTETMLFMRSVLGIQGKLNELYSRLLTLAVRLMGFDVVVHFRYNAIDLRPEAELEAFKSQKQSRLLELLSLGLLTDEEASLELTGRLPPKGFKPLSGTMFMSKSAGANENPNGESNNGSTLNQNLNSDAPKQTRGGNTKGNPTKAEAGEVIRLER
jgi:hypothetical protein